MLFMKIIMCMQDTLASQVCDGVIGHVAKLPGYKSHNLIWTTCHRQ